MEFRKDWFFVEYFNEEKPTCLTIDMPFGLRTEYRALCIDWN
jgi:hypothetical protein